MDKSTFNPLGPVGSIIIGLVLFALHFAGFSAKLGVNLTWLGIAFVFGGTILLMVRIMNEKKKQLPK